LSGAILLRAMVPLAHLGIGGSTPSERANQIKDLPHCSLYLDMDRPEGGTAGPHPPGAPSEKPCGPDGFLCPLQWGRTSGAPQTRNIPSRNISVLPD